MTAPVRVSQQAEKCDPARAAFRKDVWSGLSQDLKSIPPKYFYDQHGSELFEAITRTPEYYPTRAELSILNDNAAAIASHVPAGAAMIEFGSGATTKARILLQAAQVAAYVPVDISGAFLASEANRLENDLPGLKVFPVAADFTQPFELPAEVAGTPLVGFFPGSTLGNFEAHEATAFLRHAAKLLGPDARLIIGIDRMKDPDILHSAYNDAAGITATFNLNLLRRINRELDANFDIEKFCHYAFYNREHSRVEMHLVSRARQKVRIDGRNFEFRRGETIHTENSYKYAPELFRTIAQGAGWRQAAVWVDADQSFSVHVLVSEEEKYISD
ncbi:MAG: L-histidine N(alpha)-methyltransferase [Rhodoplanes sp.]|jgi:dimethylhistidine N-methyltransferase